MTKSTNIYEYLNPKSSSKTIAAAYKQFVGQSGGKDNQKTQEQAVKFLQKVGVSDATIKQSYQEYVSSRQKPSVEPVKVDVAGQFSGVTQQMLEAGVSQQEINTFLQSEQGKADASARDQAAAEAASNDDFAQAEALADAQAQAAIYKDNQMFLRAQAEIAAQVAKEQGLIAQQRAKYEAQIAAQQEAAASIQREAEAAQAAIAKQLAETQRLAAEMAAKSKAEMEAMQRTSAAKIAGSRKAGRSAADRSLLTGYAAADTGAPTLGGVGSLGGQGGSLGISGTLGV